MIHYNVHTHHPFTTLSTDFTNPNPNPVVTCKYFWSTSWNMKFSDPSRSFPNTTTVQCSDESEMQRSREMFSLLNKVIVSFLRKQATSDFFSFFFDRTRNVRATEYRNFTDISKYRKERTSLCIVLHINAITP